MVEEAIILEGLKQADSKPQAFDKLVKSYQEMLYYHIRRMVVDHDDADDVLQNAFLKAWRYIDRFRGDASLKTWLYRIATNEALSFLESKRRRQHQDIEDLQNDLRHSLGGGRYISGDEMLQKLHEAILLLPEKQQLVFNMRYFDEMKYHEIAGVLETSEGGLKANYHHAVKKIEKYLKMDT